MQPLVHTLFSYCAIFPILAHFRYVMGFVFSILCCTMYVPIFHNSTPKRLYGQYASFTKVTYIHTLLPSYFSKNSKLNWYVSCKVKKNHWHDSHSKSGHDHDHRQRGRYLHTCLMVHIKLNFGFCSHIIFHMLDSIFFLISILFFRYNMLESSLWCHTSSSN